MISSSLNVAISSSLNRDDWEVVIVDDCSREEERMDDIIKKYKFNINYIFIDEKEKGARINPGYTFNKGFAAAKGEIIIIQNSECFHITDILSYTENHLTDKNYLVFSCFATYNDKATSMLVATDKKKELVDVRTIRLCIRIKYVARNRKSVTFPGEEVVIQACIGLDDHVTNESDRTTLFRSVFWANRPSFGESSDSKILTCLVASPDYKMHIVPSY